MVANRAEIKPKVADADEKSRTNSVLCCFVIELNTRSTKISRFNTFVLYHSYVHNIYGPPLPILCWTSQNIIHQAT